MKKTIFLLAIGLLIWGGPFRALANPFSDDQVAAPVGAVTSDDARHQEPPPVKNDAPSLKDGGKGGKNDKSKAGAAAEQNDGPDYLQFYGMGSHWFWMNGNGPGSKWFWFNGYDPGSKWYWENGDGPGSKWFWFNGSDPGSKWYWENGDGPRSKWYWENGDDRGSKWYWGTGCD